KLENKINADKYPVAALLDHNNNYSGVKFHGVPGGHELNSFILAIYNLLCAKVNFFIINNNSWNTHDFKLIL
ncbi:hypothetical protein Q604_UNBC16225G0001, partial [human gut metagenome]